jgi:hypothetical protein
MPLSLAFGFRLIFCSTPGSHLLDLDASFAILDTPHLATTCFSSFPLALHITVPQVITSTPPSLHYPLDNSDSRCNDQRYPR